MSTTDNRVRTAAQWLSPLEPEKRYPALKAQELGSYSQASSRAGFGLRLLSRKTPNASLVTTRTYCAVMACPGLERLISGRVSLLESYHVRPEEFVSLANEPNSLSSRM